MKGHDIVLLSTADWDNPFWTNKQHVAQELARLGHRVLYIDSLGLRRPSASARDLKRIFARLGRALRPPRRVRANLWVWSPVVLPWQGSPVIRRINRWLLRAGLQVWQRALRLRQPWLWTYSPLTTEFFDLSRFGVTVYHCVDEIKAQPGMPVRVLEQAEERLVRHVDVVFTTSPRLTQTRKVWNERTHYLPNVADYEHFSTALAAQTQVPADLAAIKGPRIGFIGALSAYKVDFQLLRQIAQSRPHWSVVLIGSVGEGDPWTDSAPLAGLPNLHLLGPRPYQALPAYLKGFDVAVLPNRINQYTDAMFPMKFFEYLAAGRPVVSVELKAIQAYSEAVSIAGSAQEFVKKIEEVLAGGAPPLERRLALAKEHTYAARTARMLEMIKDQATASNRASIG